MIVLRLQVFCLFVLMMCGLQACGGGGGGSNSTPAPTLSISSVSPLSAFPGDTLQVQGAGLNRVQKALVGGVDANFTILSDSQLTLLVPAAALSGIVELHAPGTLAQSLERVSILNAPSVSGFSPTIARPGDTVTISGVNLDQVREVRVNNLLLTLTQKSAQQISFALPSEARSGTVSLSYSNNRVLNLSQSLTVQTPVILRSLNPLEGLVGAIITLDGEGLDLVEQVQFGAQSTSPLQRSVTRLTVAVPVGASSAPLTLVTLGGDRIVSREVFSVIPKIIFTDLQPSAARVGLKITINGQNLDEVSNVLVNGTAVNLLTRSATALSFSMPVGGGQVVLKGRRQADVSAGTLTEQASGVQVAGFSPTSGLAGSQVSITGMNLDKVVSASIASVAATIVSRSSNLLILQVPPGGSGAILLVADGANVSVGNFVLTTGPNKASVTISRVEVAQTYLQAPGDFYQRLVPGKAALLRVVVAAQDGTVSPIVQLTASAGNLVLGSVQLIGPATLSATPQVGDLAQSFNTKLPANWLRENLKLQIDVDPQKVNTNGASYTAQPLVGKTTNFNLVLVPLSISEGNLEAVVPDLTSVKTLLGKVLPIPEASIKLTQRAAYRLTSVTKVKTDDEWSKALSELDTLRDAEGQQKHYYGFVPDDNFQSGNSGLGYVPNSAGNGDSRTSIGLDARQSFHLRTMTHELGHNLGRDHAPCGGVTSPDPAFPYANGSLGPTLIYDNVTELLAVISKPSDVMGYCQGSWFSDYNYFHIQSWLESWLYPFSQPMKVFSESVELLEIGGEIDLNGVRFQPVSGSIGQPTRAQGAQGAQDNYQLRMQLNDGSLILEPFKAVKVADSSRALVHFKLKLVKPALEIVKMEVLKNGQILPINQTRSNLAAQRIGDPGPSLSWQEVGDQLQLSWNDSRYKYLTVSHFGAQATLLARQLQGGKAQLSIRSLPLAGEWQLVLSDGLNTRLIRVKR